MNDEVKKHVKQSSTITGGILVGTSALVTFATAFGMSLSEGQQAAILGLVGALIGIYDVVRRERR